MNPTPPIQSPHATHAGGITRISKTCLAALLFSSFSPALQSAEPTADWEACGWGGGGFYYSAAYHPTKKGVIYMGSDVAGAYKTEDNGQHWRMINNGLANYGVFSLAVDRQQPDTVYAATEGGLCKSTDAGEHWSLLPKTERKELRITGEKGKSIRCIAVDPSNSNNVYAASPNGLVYKSIDGGQTWKTSYEQKKEAEDSSLLAVQFGKANGGYFGNMWFPVEYPADGTPAECFGFGLTIKGEGIQPKQALLILKLASGVTYRSKNLGDLFTNNQWRDLILNAQDFTIDPDYAKNNAQTAASASPTPDFSSVKRVDFVCSGNLPAEASLAKIRKFFFAKGTAEKPVLLTARDFATDKAVQTVGNIHLGGPVAGPVRSVAVSAKNPAMVAAATEDAGLVLSEDGGATWRELGTLKKASSVAFDPANPNIMYGTFFSEGIFKSTDKGKTWANIVPKGLSINEVVVSPANSQDVYAIGVLNWNGAFCSSNDGGVTWKRVSRLTVDLDANPTLEMISAGTSNISFPSNIALNPLDPKQIFLSANWRPCLSEDGGLTWKERDRGTDISCVHDIRFSGTRAYVSVMDEGTLVTENNGKNWRQLWPLKSVPDLNGHNWKLGISNVGGVDHIISTFTPWNQMYPPGVITSDDGGKNFKVTRTGLPDYVVRPNTMWGAGAPRALVIDPNDPKVAYLGIDGDPSQGKMGGGIFKSEDSGSTWKQLANQPASRRMFYGLAVDPSDSTRLYWGTCGTGGGLYRSTNGGESWKSVFANDTWIFNVVATKAGDVYCGGNNLWGSIDHGTTWKKLTKFPGVGRSVVAIEVDPRNDQTLWISMVSWDLSSNGGVYKTTDGGATWQDITGNLAYNKPVVLRFNPATNELWAGGVTLHKIKQ